MLLPEPIELGDPEFARLFTETTPLLMISGPAKVFSADKWMLDGPDFVKEPGPLTIPLKVKIFSTLMVPPPAKSVIGRSVESFADPVRIKVPPSKVRGV